MFLALQFLTETDILLFPVCVVIFYYILRTRAKRNPDPKIRSLYYKAFYFKVICVLASTLITEFYFKGGDTGLYYQAMKDMRAAIADDPANLLVSLTASKVSPTSPLFNYFYYDNYEFDVTYNYMVSAHNFLPPKFALIPSYLFFNSYICICMCFGFFALGGAIRLFKTFYYFYPRLYRELALACLFLPGVAFWSSSLLKDPISFGCIGFILFAIINLVFRKTNFWSSIFWLLFAGYLLYSSKIYILLVLLLSLLVWLFADFNRLIKDRTLRNIFTVLTFVISSAVGYLLLNYVTSLEAAQGYQLESLAANAERERAGYAAIAQKIQGDSHFSINTSNPLMLVIGGISATFYRPFLWEINSPIAFLSAAESLMFLLISLGFVMKKGIVSFFTTPFSDGKILMCFVFAFVFAMAVGISTANFGALSRYKIPCMPFYLVMLILMYRKTGLTYPRWFQSVIDFVVPK
jgi:hypothetical protein